MSPNRSWEGTFSALVADPPAALFSDAALDIAALALVDLVGVTLAGTAEPAAAVVGRYLDTEGAGTASVVGRAARTTAGAAAFGNAVLGHVLDYDDSNLVIGGHPSVVIFPALLALAEVRALPGDAVLRAYSVGFDVAVRLARGVNFHHYEKGWHPSATLGVFGAALGAAHLLGLDAVQARNALGFAATSAAGVKASFGTLAKPIQLGRAAQMGVQAALLAQAGADAAAEVLTARLGFLNVYNGAGNYLAEPPAWDGVPELLTSSLSFKNYPCCGSTHVVIDTAVDLKRRGLPDAIAAVEVAMNPRRIPHVDRPDASDPLGAKFSVQFCAAAALIDGALGLDHFTAEATAREDIRALAGRIRLAAFDGAEALDQPCRITVTAADGTTVSAELPGPRGRDPASSANVAERKFTDCASRVLPPEAVVRLWAQLRGIRDLPDVRLLMADLAATPTTSPLQRTC